MSSVHHRLHTCDVRRYLESLVEYLENYALRVRPLLDVSEVSVLMMFTLMMMMTMMMLVVR